jgi:hypothetical protein
MSITEKLAERFMDTLQEITVKREIYAQKFKKEANVALARFIDGAALILREEMQKVLGPSEEPLDDLEERKRKFERDNAQFLVGVTRICGHQFCGHYCKKSPGHRTKDIDDRHADGLVVWD